MNPLPDPLPLVSIVTPSLNQGQYIEETILSVLNQDYPNIEYAVIDGGSTDNTIDILRKYQDRLLWVSEKDRGQSDAINKGFRMAKGDILAWLNSDDTYLPSAVNKAVSLLNSHSDTKMVYGKTHYSDETGKIIGEYPTGPLDYKRLAIFNFICQPSTFFKKEVFFDAGGLDLELRHSMDYDLWIRIVRNFSVEYLPEYLSIYRLHSQSKTISEIHALKSSEECLKTVMKYYNWAPANRVYGYCHHFVKYMTPTALVKIKPLIVFFALIVSLVQYIYLNKGIRLEDVKMINPENIRKLFKDWIDIIKGS